MWMLFLDLQARNRKDNGASPPGSNLSSSITSMYLSSVCNKKQQSLIFAENSSRKPCNSFKKTEYVDANTTSLMP